MAAVGFHSFFQKAFDLKSLCQEDRTGSVVEGWRPGKWPDYFGQQDIFFWWISEFSQPNEGRTPAHLTPEETNVLSAELSSSTDLTIRGAGGLLVVDGEFGTE